MNFYDLKSKLNFPYLVGAVRLKADMVILMELNEERAGRLFDLEMLMGLNSNERDRPYEAEIRAVLSEQWRLHKEDVATIKKYLIQHKMLE